MSAASHSQALGTASGTNAAASHHRDNDEHSSIVQLAGPVSALAIEVLHGRIGCAVFLDEEQQLLLCEDLPCDFAFHDQAAASSARDTAAPPENVEVGSATGHEARNVPANSDAWNGYVGSRKCGTALGFERLLCFASTETLLRPNSAVAV